MVRCKKCSQEGYNMGTCDRRANINVEVDFSIATKGVTAASFEPNAMNQNEGGSQTTSSVPKRSAPTTSSSKGKKKKTSA